LGLPEQEHLVRIGEHAHEARRLLKEAQSDLADGRCSSAIGGWGIANLRLGFAQGHREGVIVQTTHDRELSKLEGDLVAFQHAMADRCGIRLGKQLGLARRRRR
jgi:hypothetical protein